MARYFATVSYLGTSYHGWQTQPNAITIQSVIEEALSRIIPEFTGIVGSGRTDTGVHASYQVFHFDSTRLVIEEKLTYQLNSMLPKDIAINSIVRVSDTAHARFDATSRSYIYRINQKKDPFLQDQSYFYHIPLNVNKMNEACERLIQHDNFECFSKVHTEVNNFLCQIMFAKWTQEKHALYFNIRANRFLRNMVRAIVGTMIDIGRGESTLEQLNDILESRDRSKAGRSVPAEGLYLNGVNYPDNIYVS